MKKWCIKRNDINHSIINEFMKTIDPSCIYGSTSGFVYSESITKRYMSHSFSDTNGHEYNHPSFKHSNFEELTFEEFERLVLNKSNEPTYEIY